MAYSKDIKNQARTLYINSGLSLELVADELKISKNTVFNWKSKAFAIGDDWEKLKAMNAYGRVESLGKNIIVQLLVNFEKSLTDLAMIDKDTLTPSEQVAILADLSESFSRAVSANKRLTPEVNKLVIALETIDGLIEFIKKNNPEALKEFANILEPFGEYLKERLKNE